jgi:acetylornithine deacetylase/succinyl-diaminopimelate desuccinylase-like protein
LEPVIDRGRLYGLGAINMKAGLACSLAAFKALVEATELHGKLGRLGFVMTVDQEGQSIGARARLKIEYGGCDAMLHSEHFFGDSEGNYLPMAATGKMLYKLTVHGRAAHAFRPQEGGINAIVDASRIIVALDRLQMREHPLFGRGTVCSLKIEGGYKTYSIIVPELCEIIITRLTVPGETTETAVRDMNDLIKSLNLESSVRVETPPPNYQPYFLDLESPFCRIFRETYRDILGKSPSFRPHVGIVDANVYAAEGGIPTVVFGPKGANHHRPGEYVEISSLEPVSRVYIETAIRYLQTNCDHTE